MSSTAQREHEAKFEVTPEEQPTLFTKSVSLAGYSAQPVATISHQDTYLDTAAFDLLRHGLALRVRHNGEANEVGIKSIQSARKGAIQDRMDVTIALPTRAKPFEASTWPDEVGKQLTASAVKLAELHPLVVVRQERQKSQLRPTASDAPLAEWSLDEVWVSKAGHHGESNGANPTSAHFHELEIEMLVPKDSDEGGQKSETDFAALVDQVQKDYKLAPTYTSKLVRGLLATLAQAHENSNVIMPTMQLEAAGRLLLHQQLLQVILNEHGVRYGKSANYVHDMRVAIRRARAAIQLCRNVIAPKTLAPYDKGFRRIGRALGAVRDLDVALANLRAFRRSQPENQRKGIKLLRSELRNRRKHAHADLIALLDSKKHRKFIEEFTTFCITSVGNEAADNIASYEVAPTQVRHTIPSLILAAFEAMRAYESVFAQHERPPLESFHATRIRAKYLRYLLEFSQHLLGNEGERLITQIRELQDHLGELNDAHVEEERLQQWAEKLKGEADLQEAIATRLAQVTKRIDELAAAAPTRFNNCVNHANRERLAKALARI
jgi:CHAD domain-containing protein